MNAEGRAVKVAPQLVHLVDKKFQALDLNLGPWKAVEDYSMLIFSAEQTSQHQPDDLAIPNHVAKVLQHFCFGRIKQRAHDEGRAGDTARLGDEFGVGALAGTWCAAQKNDFFRETQVFTAELGLKLLPNRFKDDVCVLDLEIAEVLGGRLDTRLR